MRSFKLVLIGVWLILFATSAHAISATPTGVLMDIWGVQVDAFQATSQKTIQSLSDSAMAEVENIYGLVEQEILDEGGVDLSKPGMLADVVDRIYDHPVFRTRAGLASSLNGINSVIDEAKAVSDLLSIAEVGQSVAQNAPKAAQELRELLRNDQRGHILRNILEYGSGNRNGRIQAWLADIKVTTHTNLFNITNSLYQIDQTNRKTAEKVFGALMYLTQKAIADDYADNISNGPWAKITLQDFVVKKWVLDGTINDGSIGQFNNQDIYSKETAAWTFLPTVEKVFKADTLYHILTQAERIAIVTPTFDPANYVDFKFVGTNVGVNKFKFTLPATITNHAANGVPTAVTFTANGSNIQSYPLAVSAVQYIDSTSIVKEFDLDLSAYLSLKTDQQLDVTVTYSSGTILSSFASITYTPQVSNVQLTTLPTQFSSNAFPVTVQYCGDILQTATLSYKSTAQTTWDLQAQLEMQNHVQIGENCRSYTLNIDGWKVYNYTGGNRDVSIKVDVAGHSSPEYTRWLANLDDTDNDGLSDVWEIQYFGSLSQAAAGDYDVDGLSNYQEFLHNTDPTKAGAAGITETEQIIPLKDLNNNWSYDFSLSGSYWSSVEQSGTSVVLRQNSNVAGNYTLVGNTLDLKGYTLTVYGDFYHGGGTLNLNGGQLHVVGNYLIQTKNLDGTFGASNGVLDMRGGGTVLVSNNFVMDSQYEHTYYLTAGTLDVKGSFTQKSTYCYNYYGCANGPNFNFNTSGTHKVKLSGTSIQTVSFEDPSAGASHFNVLEIINNSVAGVVLATPVVVIKELVSTTTPITNQSNMRLAATAIISGGSWNDDLTIDTGWTMQQSQTITKDLFLTGGTLDLQGKTLTVSGNLYHSGGILNLNGGQLYVVGNYLIQTKNLDGTFGASNGVLDMQGGGTILVDGNFVMDSQYDHTPHLTAGTLDVKGNFTQKSTYCYYYYGCANGPNLNFSTFGTHRVKLSGTSIQTVSFEDPGTYASHFNILEITNNSVAGVVFATPVVVIKELVSTTTPLTNQSNIRLAGTAIISGGSWNDDLTIDTGWTMQQSQTITKDLFLTGGTLDLQGKTLTVSGNLYHSGGILNLNGGQLHVVGNYLIQTKNLDGTFGASNGVLDMQGGGTVLVNGNFVMDSQYDHTYHLTAGTLDVKGNFTQKSTYCQLYYSSCVTGPNLNFSTSGTHRVKLSGTSQQTVSFEDPGTYASHFNILEITNNSVAGVVFATPVVVIKELVSTTTPLTNQSNMRLAGTAIISGGNWNDDLTVDTGWTMQQAQVVTKDLYLTGGMLDLNGKSLIISGNLYHSGGTLNLNGGQLHVVGNYLIQTKNLDGTFGASTGYLGMQGGGTILVDGNFVIDSQYDHTSYLTAGTLDVKGDFTQKSTYCRMWYSSCENGPNFNFNTSGTHRVKLSGTSQQTVSFEDPSAGVSHFNILEITNTSTAGVIFATRVVVTTLFNHHNNKFTITDPTSEFPDYDGDGVKDDLDSQPTNPLVWAPDKILTLTISGSGDGSVNSVPSGIACTSGTCNGTFEDGTTVIISALADTISTFAGWSGACAGKNDCSISMTADRAVTATFTLAPKAMTGSNGYDSLYLAYSGAATSADILVLGSEHVENLTMSGGKHITIKGGYRPDYLGRADLPTVLKGGLTIGTGSLTVDGLTIR